MRRRGFLLGLTALAAPAIIRMPGLLMPIKALRLIDPSEADWAKLAWRMFEADAKFWDGRKVTAATERLFKQEVREARVVLTEWRSDFDRPPLGFDPNARGVGPDYVPTWRRADKGYRA